jgi:hypothetical protein
MTDIIVTGYIVKFPLGGMTWNYLQPVIGLKKLGCNVYYFENSPWTNACYNPDLNLYSDDCSYGVNYLKEIMNHFGLAKNWVFIDNSGKHYGLNQKETKNLLEQADALIDYSGTSWLPDFSKCKKLIYFDGGPGYTQFRYAQMIKSEIKQPNNWRNFSIYDHCYSFGLNIGEPDCSIPTSGIKWEKMHRPVVLNLWEPNIDPTCEKYTTIMSWSTGSMEYEGETYGPKSMEFLKFLDLPNLTNEKFELAIGGGLKEKDSSMLKNAGWNITNAPKLTKDLWATQEYIQKSKAEWTVVKNAYVKTWSGWFGNQSACYLASGKPVLIQDTGFSKYYSSDKGLIAFKDLDDVLVGFNDIRDDYVSQCEAARQKAEKYFNSNHILKDFLQKTKL